MKHDLYQQVTNQIIAELEQGALPWVQEWRDGANGLPVNGATRRPYSGINILILWLTAQNQEYSSCEWMTYKQASGAGGQVRKGEKGTHVVFYKSVEKEEIDQESGEVEKKNIPMMRSFVVFNRDQIEGLEEGKPSTEFARLDDAEALIKATGAAVVAGKPAYNSRSDMVKMPPVKEFESSQGYYATLLHELTHWSGHRSRLNRDLSGRFGSLSYATEELVAELGAAFLCAELNIPGKVRHAGYIENWLQVLKKDNKAIFKAAAQASRAVEHIKSYQGER